MTAAKIMDMKHRLPGCSGQAADAVSAYTQVKMEDAPTLFQNSKSQNVQMFGYVHQSTQGPNHGPIWKIRSFLLNEIWQDHYGKGNSREFFLKKHGFEKILNWECLFANREKGLFLSAYVDDVKLDRKKQSIRPTWKVLMEYVYFGRTNTIL